MFFRVETTQGEIVALQETSARAAREYVNRRFSPRYGFPQGGMTFSLRTISEEQARNMVEAEGAISWL